MASILRKISAGMHRFFLFIGSVSLILMTVIVCVTVFLRYVLNAGNSVAEEVPRLLVTLLAFIAMAMGVRDHAHISADILYNRFPKGGIGRKVLDVFGDIVVLLCGVFMLYFGIVRIITMHGMTGNLPMTGLPVWIQYIPVPVGGLMITYDSILFLTGVLKRDDHLFDDSGEDGIVEAAIEQMKQQKEEVAKP